LKATIEFDLPEEAEEYKIYSNALDMASVLHEIDNYCRSCVKHDDIPEDTIYRLERIRDMITLDL